MRGLVAQAPDGTWQAIVNGAVVYTAATNEAAWTYFDRGDDIDAAHQRIRRFFSGESRREIECTVE